MPRQQCSPVTRQECSSVPRRVEEQQCFEIPRQSCRQVEKQVAEETCSDVPRQQCGPVARQNCQTVPRQQCRSVSLLQSQTDSQYFQRRGLHPQLPAGAETAAVPAVPGHPQAAVLRPLPPVQDSAAGAMCPCLQTCLLVQEMFRSFTILGISIL